MSANTASSVRFGARASAFLLAAMLVLTGCAAGQDAQTAVEAPVVDGVSADVGQINIRNLSVQAPVGDSYAVGSNAGLQLVIVNTNTSADSLVSVSSPAATSVKFFPNAPAAAATVVAPSVTASPTATRTTPSTAPSTAASSGSASASPSASPSASTTAADGSITSIILPAGENSSIGLSPYDRAILLVGLKQSLAPSQAISVTFNFANAGSVTVRLAVHLKSGPVNAPTLATTHPEANQ